MIRGIYTALRQLYCVPSYLSHSSPAWSSSPASIDLSYTTWASRAIASGAPPKPKPAVPDPAWPFSSPPACPSPVNKYKHKDITRYISHTIHSFAMLGPPTQTHTYYHCYSPRTGASLPSSPRAARTKFTGLRPRTAAHCSAVAWMPTVGRPALNTQHPARMRAGLRNGGRPHGLCCGTRSQQVSFFGEQFSGLARILLWGPDRSLVGWAVASQGSVCMHGLLRGQVSPGPLFFRRSCVASTEASVRSSETLGTSTRFAGRMASVLSSPSSSLVR